MNVLGIGGVVVGTERAKDFCRHDFRKTDDGIQRFTQLVAHGGKEFGLHAVGRFSFVARLDQFGLAFLQGGDIGFDDDHAAIFGSARAGQDLATIDGLLDAGIAFKVLAGQALRRLGCGILARTGEISVFGKGPDDFTVGRM